MNFSVPSIFSGLMLTTDKGGALRFRTHKELTDEEVTAMKNSFNESGTVIFVQGDVTEEEIAAAQTKHRDAKQRTASQELRGALYVAYQHGVDVQTDETWDHYYRRRMLTIKARVLEEIQEAEG